MMGPPMSDSVLQPALTQLTGNSRCCFALLWVGFGLVWVGVLVAFCVAFAEILGVQQLCIWVSRNCGCNCVA